MEKFMDILASGIHDAKNQLMGAESVISVAEMNHGIDLSEARYAIERAAGRLNQTIRSYQLANNIDILSFQPIVVCDLVEELVLENKRHLKHGNLVCRFIKTLTNYRKCFFFNNIQHF